MQTRWVTWKTIMEHRVFGCFSYRSQNEKPFSLLLKGWWRERIRASAPSLTPVAKSLGMKMHHGMGVSTGDRRCGENSTMQPRNGVCDKIENYISDLGQWYVSEGWLADVRRYLKVKAKVDPPLEWYTRRWCRLEEGSSRIKVAGVCCKFSCALFMNGKTMPWVRWPRSVSQLWSITWIEQNFIQSG